MFPTSLKDQNMSSSGFNDYQHLPHLIRRSSSVNENTRSQRLDACIRSPNNSISSSPLTLRELPTAAAPSTNFTTTTNPSSSVLPVFPHVKNLSDPTITAIPQLQPDAPFLRQTTSSQLRLQRRQKENSTIGSATNDTQPHNLPAAAAATVNFSPAARSVTVAVAQQKSRLPPSTASLSSATPNAPNYKRLRSTVPATFSCPTLSSSPKVVDRLSYSNARLPKELTEESTRESVSTASATKLGRKAAPTVGRPQQTKPPRIKRPQAAAALSLNLHSTATSNCSSNKQQQSKPSSSVCSLSPSSSTQQPNSSRPRSISPTPSGLPATRSFSLTRLRSQSSSVSYIKQGSSSTADNNTTVASSSSLTLDPANIQQQPAEAKSVLPVEAALIQGEAQRQQQQPLAANNCLPTAALQQRTRKSVTCTASYGIYNEKQLEEPTEQQPLNVKSVRATLEAFPFDSPQSQQSTTCTLNAKPEQVENSKHLADSGEAAEQNNQQLNEVPKQSSSEQNAGETIQKKQPNCTPTRLNETKNEVSTHEHQHQQSDLIKSCLANITNVVVKFLAERCRRESEKFDTEMKSFVDEFAAQLKLVTSTEQHQLFMEETAIIYIENVMAASLNSVIMNAIKTFIVPEVQELLTKKIRKSLEENLTKEMEKSNTNKKSATDLNDKQQQQNSRHQTQEATVEEIKPDLTTTRLDDTDDHSTKRSSSGIKEGDEKEVQSSYQYIVAELMRHNEKLDCVANNINQLKDQLKDQQAALLQQQQSLAQQLLRPLGQQPTAAAILTPPRERIVAVGARTSSCSLSNGKVQIGGGRKGMERWSAGNRCQPQWESSGGAYDTPCSWALSDSLALSESQLTLLQSQMSVVQNATAVQQPISQQQPCKTSKESNNAEMQQLPTSSQHHQLTQLRDWSNQFRQDSVDVKNDDIKASQQQQLMCSGDRMNIDSIDRTGSDCVGGLFNEDRYQNLLSYGNDSYRSSTNIASQHFDTESYRESQNRESQFLHESLLDLSGIEYNHCDQNKSSIHLELRPEQNYSDRLDDDFEVSPRVFSISTPSSNIHQSSLSDLGLSSLEATRLGTIAEMDSTQSSGRNTFRIINNQESRQSSPSSQKQQPIYSTHQTASDSSLHCQPATNNKMGNNYQEQQFHSSHSIIDSNPLVRNNDSITMSEYQNADYKDKDDGKGSPSSLPLLRESQAEDSGCDYIPIPVD